MPGSTPGRPKPLVHFLEVNRNYQTSSDPSVRLQGIRLETELRLRQQLITTLAMNREQALLEEKNDIPILNILDPGNLPIHKSRPSRGSTVMSAFLAAFFLVLAWQHRAWIKANLIESGK